VVIQAFSAAVTWSLRNNWNNYLFKLRKLQFIYLVISYRKRNNYVDRLANHGHSLTNFMTLLGDSNSLWLNLVFNFFLFFLLFLGFLFGPPNSLYFSSFLIKVFINVLQMIYVSFKLSI